MKMLQMVVAAAVAIGFTATAFAADDKVDLKKQLLGKWEATKVDEGTLPKGAIVEFAADGKISVTFKKGDKAETMAGTYTVDGMTFTYKFVMGKDEHSEKITVTKISATEMDTVSPDKKGVSFTKAK